LIALLQVRNLTVYYRLKSGESCAGVEDVSFYIAPGETLGLMGESGCGKSSIALAIMGLLPPEQAHVAGSIVFRGDDLLSLGEHQLQKFRGSSISIVHQEPEMVLSPMMHVGRQVAEVVHAHRALSWKECKNRACDILARVGLTQIDRIYESFPHQLSGGQRERVVLAQALVCEPALLIADEPTAHLDLQSQNEFLDLLNELKSQSQTSVLLISHAPEIQARLADRLLVMHAGRIVETGIVRPIAERSQNTDARDVLVSPNRGSEHRHAMLEEKPLG
jgi:peptide/nickel transport system ATP-binding protein